MAKKNRFLKMFVAALVFGSVLVGYPTESEEEKDTWSNVTSLDQLDGTWKGSYSQTQNIKDFVGEENWNEETAVVFGDMKVAMTVEITLTIKATDKKQSMSMTMTMTMTFSGGNIAAMWDTLKTSMGSGEGVTTNDANHSISMTMDEPEETIADDEITEMFQGFQINQNGTKVKFPFPFPAGTMDPGSPEIIFTKQ